MSTVTAPANTFSHPVLQDLVKRASAIPGVGPVIVQAVHDLVHPQDPVLCCHYLLDGPTTSGGYYACDVTIVTSTYFISLSILPKNHSYRKKKVFSIGDLSVKYDPPPMDVLAATPPGGFTPPNLQLTVAFTDDRGQLVETWVAEASGEAASRQLNDIARTLSRVVGFPLAKVGAPRPAGAPA